MSNEQVVYSHTSSDEIFNQNSTPATSFKVTLRSETRIDELSSDLYPGFRSENKILASDIGDSDKCDIILCVLWKSGKLGGAYYNSADYELYIVADILDLSPEFTLMKNLYHHIKPNHTITIGNSTSQFVHALACVSQNCSDESENSSMNDSIKSLPPNIQLLKTKEYTYDVCEHAVRNLRLPTEPPDSNENDRLIYLSSLINFERQISVHALGALLLFLNKYKNTIRRDEERPDNQFYLNINTVSVQDVVLMDPDTFQALQIFNPVGHPAAFKRGQPADNKEGLSLFKLFNRCMSSLGRTNLRAILLHPTNNVITLTKRLEFIDFCQKPINNSLIKGIQDCLKNIFPLSTTLNKIHGSLATINNWKILYSTLHNIKLVQQLCVPHSKEVELFQEFDKSINHSIELILKTVNDTIDFETSTSFKISVKNGIDELLDKKKQYRAELRDKITLAASYEIHNLPPYIKDCSIVYIPHIGYLVAVQKWNENASHTELEEYGFRHMFALGDIFNFKSPVCDELDACLGDIHTDIKNHESRLILRLSQHVIERSNYLKAPLKFIAYFDSLICMANVAKEFGYIRPEIVLDNVIKIEGGRHPLLDISIPNFVPNNFYSGGENSVMKIITGPNNSGKSIYLKQTALIVYMAHIGSYVPAKSAKIGIMSGIHSSIQSVESASVRMSAFAIDLRQMSQAAKCSKKNSLIIIDEFGKATMEYDGLALLTAYLEQFLLCEEHCPHVLVSTHYLRLIQLLPESARVEHFKCEHKLDKDKIIFLYRIIKGISSSFAIQAALCASIPEDIIKRSKEFLKQYRGKHSDSQK